MYAQAQYDSSSDRTGKDYWLGYLVALDDVERAHCAAAKGV